MQRTYKKVKVSAQRFKGFKDGLPECENVEYILTNPRLKEEYYTDAESVQKALKAQIGKEANNLNIQGVEVISKETYFMSEEDFLRYATKIEE